MRLVTIPFSHYSEKARWALDHTGLPYTEDAYMPGLHQFATRPLGGRSVPVLVDGSSVQTDSTDILLHIDRLAPAGRKLYPDDPAERAAALDLEDWFDRKLGVYSRAWAYGMLLGDVGKLAHILGRKLPTRKRLALRALMPAVKPLIIKQYRVTLGEHGPWLDKLRAVFDDVSRRLGSSGGYLVGNRFSAADLTFAALAAPALGPPEHPVMPADPSEMPPLMREVVVELRASPAGQHALRMYRQHRR